MAADPPDFAALAREMFGVSGAESNPLVFRRPGLGEVAAALRNAYAAGRRAGLREGKAKIEEQSRLLTAMFHDVRHEPLCRDLAAALEALAEEDA